MINVEVYYENRLLKGIERPVRRMPDGQHGVTYKGRLFPLVAGNRIYIAGGPPPAPPGTELVGLATAQHLDTSGRYPYLMVNGSEQVLTAVTIALKSLGAEIQSSGRSRRPADDDAEYDWYIRLDDSEPSLAAAQSLIPPVTQRPPVRIPEPSTPRRPAVRGRVIVPDAPGGQVVTAVRSQPKSPKHELELARIQLDGQQLHLQAKLKDVTEELEGTKGELGQLAAKLRSATEERDDLRHTVDRLARAPKGAQSNSGPLQARISALEKEATSLAEQVRDAVETGNVYGQERDNLKAKVIELEQAPIRLQETLDDLKEDHVEAMHQLALTGEQVIKSVQRRIELLKSVFSGAFRTITLVRDSFEFLADDVQSYEGVCRRLFDLCHNPHGGGGKKVQGTSHWWECPHFAIGHGRKPGRIYYRLDGSQYNCLLSRKPDQKADIGWLLDHDGPTCA